MLGELRSVEIQARLALVLDGDWDERKKRNLYEAGWDWIGDVGQLDELRRLIQE